MTLSDVLLTLDTRGALPHSRVPAIQTSLRYLAAALGHPSPEACPVDVACREEATWGSALEAHWRTREAEGRTISAYTRRNVKNDVRRVFTLASAHGLLPVPMPARLLPRPARRDTFLREQRATAPYRGTYAHGDAQHYGLPQRQWPEDIQAGWRGYQEACGLRIREVTLHGYAKMLQTYFGYLANVCGRLPTWEDLFDPTQLMAYARWHATRQQCPSTAYARQLVIASAAIAKVLGHPKAPALATLRQGIKKPRALHVKRAHWVSLADLEAVADACLAEGRAQLSRGRRSRYPGARRAIHFARGVMLKLLVRVPLRQRNVREMQINRHLYKDDQGDWHLHFEGGDLKIGHRGAEVNVYELNLSTYCPEFIPILEEWLQVWRPKLPNAATSPCVFLTSGGHSYDEASLRVGLSEAVAMYTGKRFFPHMVRTVWATEFLERHPGAYDAVATALGDTVAVVIKTYQNIVEQEQRAKGAAFLSEALQRG